MFLIELIWLMWCPVKFGIRVPCATYLKTDPTRMYSLFFTDVSDYKGTGTGLFSTSNFTYFSLEFLHPRNLRIRIYYFRVFVSIRNTLIRFTQFRSVSFPKDLLCPHLLLFGCRMLYGCVSWSGVAICISNPDCQCVYWVTFGFLQ